MIDVEPVIREELERLSPRRVGRSDWADVIGRAERASIAPEADGRVPDDVRLPGRVRSEPRRRRTALRFATAAAAVAVAASALAVTAPWEGGPTLVERALAAVGTGPVLHAVIVAPPQERDAVIEIASGEARTRERLTEIWFDASRDLKKTVMTLDGFVLDEILENAEGGFTRGGPVITCSWIAAHPVEATKLGVSCRADGENGTTPRDIPEQPPILEESLAGFVDHYADALAAGRAREGGRGRAAGRDVIWLEIDVPAAGGGAARVERVALDSASYKPLLVETAGGATRFAIREIETVPYAPWLFTKPSRITAPDGGSGGSVKSKRVVSPAEAAAALQGKVLWLGENWRDYRLVETRLVDLRIGYGALSEREPTNVTGVELDYGRTSGDGTIDKESVFTLRETTACIVYWGGACTEDPAQPGTMTRRGPITRVLKSNVFVTIWDWNNPDDPSHLELARDLHRVGG
jgi:hypothetical protein